MIASANGSSYPTKGVQPCCSTPVWPVAQSPVRSAPAQSSALAETPPNCTAGDVAQVRGGVSAGTSAYLFTHPWVNDFFTGLSGQPRDQIRTQVQNYLTANPQEQAELQAIRQPLADLKNRCGTGTFTPAQ